MNKLFYPTIALALILFFYGKYYFDENSQADRLSNKLIDRVGSRLEKKYHLSMSAIGGGGDSKGLRLLNISFDHQGEPFTRDEARKLIVNLTQEFLKEINNDENLRPYLVSFPFTPSNLHIAVIFFDSNRNFIFDPFPIIVSASNGKIGYFTKSPENLFQDKSKVYELYEEALAIVNSEK